MTCYRIYRVGVALAVGLMLASCTGLTNEIQQESARDASIATRIKARLLEEPELSAAAIQVESNRGRVTLDGFVETRGQRKHAARLAREVEGVGELVNEIKVKE